MRSFGRSLRCASLTPHSLVVMCKEEIAKKLLILSALWGAGYSVYVISECMLLCSETVMFSTGFYYWLAVISYFLSPVLAIIGAILLWRNRISGPTLLIVAGAAMAYAYGPANLPEIIKAAIPIFAAGLLGIVLTGSRKAKSACS